MSSSKFKTLAYSLSVISAIMLTGCDKRAAEAPFATDSSTATVTSTAASHTSTLTKPTEAFERTGLFTGQFDPTRDYSKAKAEYDKWAEETGYEGSRDLKDTPAQFRKYMYQDPLYGFYNFITPNRLSIVIDEIREDKTFTAHSVAAGNQRETIGTWQPIEGGLRLVGNEPGDDPNDGSFDMKLSEKGLAGTWTHKKDQAEPKAFTLVKTKFEYDPKLAQNEEKVHYIALGDAQFDKNPSIDKLKTADVENLTQPQIRVIRNLVFARHGYSFKGKDLRLMFEAYDWYIPVSNDVKAQLTELEKANIALLNRYEKYADKHYDEFGR